MTDAELDALVARIECLPEVRKGWRARLAKLLDYGWTELGPFCDDKRSTFPERDLCGVDPNGKLQFLA